MININKFQAFLFVVMLILSACSGTVSDEDNVAIPTVVEDDTELDVTQITEQIPEEVPDVIDEAISEDIPEDVFDVGTKEQNETAQDEKLTVEDYEALGINEMGHIMVIMYHGIKDNPPYHRIAEDFIKDLQYMYDNGYRLISISDYLSQNIDVEVGMTPIVLTFDDALSTTFSLVETDDGLVVNPESAIGLLEDFIKEHPDFGRGGGLFIHDTKANFRGDGTAVDRLNWLLDHGYELGNHSATHADLSKLDGEGLIKEIGQVDELLLELGIDYKMQAITYPYGKKPEDSVINLLTNSSYNDVVIHYEVGFREGPSTLPYCPLDVRFNPLSAPRIRGSEGEIQDMWWFFEHYDVDHPEQKYISDGNPDTIVVPSAYEGNVDINKIEDKELIVY